MVMVTVAVSVMVSGELELAIAPPLMAEPLLKLLLVTFSVPKS